MTNRGFVPSASNSIAVACAMQNDKESPFTLTLLDVDLSLQVVRFSGLEALNQPFRFDIDAIDLTPAIPPEQLLYQPAYLDFGQGQGIHGVLHSVGQAHRGAHRVAYKLVLVPRLQALEQQCRRRIFRDLNVPMILRQLLEDNGLPVTSYRFELTTGHYPFRPFCIQYDETDLALLQRLCEEEGIHYHFEHQRDGHVLVLADDSLSFPQEPLIVPYHDALADNVDGPVITELYQRHDSPPIPARADASNRGTSIPGDGAANQSIGVTAPLHRPARQPHPEQLSRRKLERLRCRQQQLNGRSNHPALTSARIIQVSEHPLGHFNDQWLITENRHEGRQPSILAEDCASMTPQYFNQFSAIPWSTAFRPPLNQRRPSVPGFQPARICGLSGLPPVLDDRGRIEVNLWPSQTAADEPCGLWLPVALACADTRIDPARLPVAGSDVLVSFLDCDPDRPVLCAVMGHPEQPRPSRPREPAGDTGLLLDWLVNRSDLTP